MPIEKTRPDGGVQYENAKVFFEETNGSRDGWAEEYEDSFVEVAKAKLGEVDSEHLEAAGMDPQEVLH